MRSATAVGAAMGSGLLRTLTETWPSAAGRPGASTACTVMRASPRPLSDAETVSWQPLCVTLTPVPETTRADCTWQRGAVSGLSRYCDRLTVRLVPAMRPSTRTGRSVACGWGADDPDLDLEGLRAALGLDGDRAGRALLRGRLGLEDDLAPTGAGLVQVDAVDGGVPRRFVLRACSRPSRWAATRGRAAGCRRCGPGRRRRGGPRGRGSAAPARRARSGPGS